MKLVDDNAAENNDMGEEMAVLRLATDRRAHRRHDLESLRVNVGRWEGKSRAGTVFGKLLDLSAGGAKITTTQKGIRIDQHIRVRIELPDYAGICPFIEKGNRGVQPKHEWVGWMNVARVRPLADNQYEVAGRLMDMDEMDRGMLGLYLSTQPLAA